MSTKSKLSTVIAVTMLSLSMFGCSGQNNNSPASQSVTPSSVDTSTNDPVQRTPLENLSVSDEFLAQCIKNSGRNFIEEISSLLCNNKGIQHLDGIEELSELKVLHLNFNQIRDINPLGQLTKLKSLYISGNQIDSLEALSNLTQLTELGIQKNHVKDVSPLQTIESLKSLHTHSNKIDDFSIIADLNLDVLSGQNHQ